MQILIYNGDADFILSHMGNAAWIREGLGLSKQTKEWSKWHGSDRQVPHWWCPRAHPFHTVSSPILQVAGYFEQFATAGKPLSFLTVKGAGHMVPKDRPRHALDMLERFLGGGDYDAVKPAKTTPLCAK